MKTLYLVRHGETDWNITRRFQGNSDVPLNDTGLAQADRLRERLQDEHFDLVYSSNLSRAMVTAQRITSQDIQPDPRLQEIHFGLWEGLHMHEIQAQFPAELAAWRKRSAPPPSGETIFQVAARGSDVLHDVLTTLQDEQRALIVSHGGMLGVLVCILLGQSPEHVWSYRFYNTSITEIVVYDFGNVLLRLNDTCHLVEE